MTEFHTIAQAKNMRTGINLEVTIKNKGEPRDVPLRSGTTLRVCNFTITDKNNYDMIFDVWGEEIDLLKIGDSVIIENGYTNQFKGETYLVKGRFGKMRIN